MAIEIGALRALLSLDSAAFDKGARRAQGSMGNLRKTLKKTSDQFRKSGRALQRGLTLPLAAVGGVALRSSLSTIDAQSKLAQSLGTSTRSMQVLARATDRAGISQGEFEQIARQLTKRLSQAATGAGPAAKALDTLGLSAQELSGLDLDDQILRINQAIADQVPVAEQAAVASQIFGDRAGLLASRLDAGTIAAASEEIERFGVAVTEVEADQIEAANDAISSLGLVTRGLANQLAVALAPSLQSISEKIAKAAEFFSSLTPEQQRFAAGAAALAAAIGPVVATLGLVAAGLAALLSPIGLVVAAVAALAAGAVTLAANWDTITARFNDFVEVAQTLATGVLDAIRTAASEAVEAARQLGADIIAGIRDGIFQRIEAVKETMRGAARSVISIFKSETEIQSPSRVFRRLGADLMAGLGLGISESAGDAAEAMRQAAGDVTGAVGVGSGVSDSVRDLSSALGDAAVKSKSLSDAFRQSLEQMASDLVSSGIDRSINALFSGFGGGASGGGLIGSLLGAIGFGGFRAGGGAVAAGSSYVVGERGPELFVPRSAGQIVPAGQFGGGGVTVNIDARGAQEGVADQVRREMDRQLPRIERVAVASVQGARRRGVKV